MKAELFQERKLEVNGWEVRLQSYKLGDIFYSQADNVSPGAWLARKTGATREEAEEKALERARELLSRTKRHDIPEANRAACS